MKTLNRNMFISVYLSSLAPCGPGKIVATTYNGIQVCEYCPVGSYTADENSVQCETCPDGTSTEYDGSTSSQECLGCHFFIFFKNNFDHTMSSQALYVWNCSSYIDISSKSENT